MEPDFYGVIKIPKQSGDREFDSHRERTLKWVASYQNRLRFEDVAVSVHSSGKRNIVNASPTRETEAKCLVVSYRAITLITARTFPGIEQPETSDDIPL